jgi:hypothetical protein
MGLLDLMIEIERYMARNNLSASVTTVSDLIEHMGYHLNEED